MMKCSPKVFLLFSLYVTTIWGETLDKEKILQIIQSAKEHKAVKIDKELDSAVIVYRKREKKKLLKKEVYMPLPSILPSSVLLQRQYLRHKKSTQKKSLFTSSQQNNNSKLKTTATKISY